MLVHTNLIDLTLKIHQIEKLCLTDYYKVVLCVRPFDTADRW